MTSNQPVYISDDDNDGFKIIPPSPYSQTQGRKTQTKTCLPAPQSLSNGNVTEDHRATPATYTQEYHGVTEKKKRARAVHPLVATAYTKHVSKINTQKRKSTADSRQPSKLVKTNTTTISLSQAKSQTIPTSGPVYLDRSKPLNGHMLTEFAETLYRSFPFQDFSEAHGYPVKQLVETFDALVTKHIISYACRGHGWLKAARREVAEWKATYEWSPEVEKRNQEFLAKIYHDWEEGCHEQLEGPCKMGCGFGEEWRKGE